MHANVSKIKKTILGMVHNKMQVKPVNELNFNSEGLIYLNTNLMISAIKVSLLTQANQASSLLAEG